MKLIIGLLSLGLSLASVEANALLFENQYDYMGKSYVRMLAKQPTDVLENLPADKRDMCIRRYNGILNDGVIDIRIALGYFDWTIDGRVFSGLRNMGYSPSIDIAGFEAMKTILTASCKGNAKICGFRQDPQNRHIFTREVEVHGRRQLARVEMHYSSETEYLNKNLGEFRQQQIERTRFIENFYVRSLQSADAVFYFGHSRNGAGPDFSPPLFIPGQNKLDYKGQYYPRMTGQKRLMNALSGSARQPAIIGMMSCDSRDHFHNRLRRIAPNSGVITSTAVLDIDQVYTAMIGAIDATLRGQCQRSFYEAIRLTPKNQQFMTMDGMFE